MNFLVRNYAGVEGMLFRKASLLFLGADLPAASAQGW